MLKNDIITKLASINVFESMVLIEQAKQENAIGDFESRLVNLEIYRREKLKLKPIRPSWVYKNLHVSVPKANNCLLYTSPSPRDRTRSRMPSSA